LCFCVPSFQEDSPRLFNLQASPNEHLPGDGWVAQPAWNPGWWMKGRLHLVKGFKSLASGWDDVIPWKPQSCNKSSWKRSHHNLFMWLYGLLVIRGRVQVQCFGGRKGT
jgi:hypothetical protein